MQKTVKKKTKKLCIWGQLPTHLKHPNWSQMEKYEQARSRTTCDLKAYVKLCLHALTALERALIQFPACRRRGRKQREGKEPLSLFIFFSQTFVYMCIIKFGPEF